MNDRERGVHVPLFLTLVDFFESLLELLLLLEGLLELILQEFLLRGREEVFDRDVVGLVQFELPKVLEVLVPVLLFDVLDDEVLDIHGEVSDIQILF